VAQNKSDSGKNDAPELVILTGFSGGRKGTALRAFEDLGYIRGQPAGRLDPQVRGTGAFLP